MTYIAKLIYLIKQISWLSVGLGLFFALCLQLLIQHLKIIYRQKLLFRLFPEAVAIWVVIEQ